MFYDVIIVGAGVAGLFAAANLPEGTKALVLEKENSPGKKLLLAGAGQCNITHSGNMRDFLTHYGSKGKTIRPILYQFGNGSVMKFFKERGVPLSQRGDGKVFPSSMKGEDVLFTLIDACGKNAVAFAYGAHVTDISPVSPQDESACMSDGAPATKGGWRVTGGAVAYKAKRVIIAAGGRSFPKTGSDGSIMPILSGLGHQIIQQRPALSPIFTANYPYANLSGVSVEDARVSVSGGEAAELGNPGKRGPLLLTHKCFSGPVILELSRYALRGNTLNICYLPGADEKSIYLMLTGSVAGSKKQFSTFVSELYGERLPKSLLDAISRRAGISPGEKASRISGSALKRFAQLLTGDEYAISGVGGFDTAMVTAGGVSLESVDIRSLESRVCPGIYFAGEILDVDGDTGGYNLQFAFSSGYLASRLM